MRITLSRRKIICIVFFELVLLILMPDSSIIHINKRQIFEATANKIRTTLMRGASGKSDVSWVGHLCPNYQNHEAESILQWEPITEDTIFFVKTSCHTFLSAREACAIESILTHHPNHSVRLMLATPTFNFSHLFTKILQSNSKMRFSWLDLDEIFANEPLHSWHRERTWMLSEGRTAAVVNDVARAELLRRYGGTYVDLDALTLRPLPNATNWLTRVDDYLVTSAVSSFTSRHPLLQEVTENIPKVFDPSSCCSVGPDLFTQLLQKMCPKNITKPSLVSPEDFEFCRDITVYPRKLFYPIHYGYKSDELESIFTEGQGLGSQFFSSTKAFSLHLFHSLSSKRTADLGSDSIVVEAAKRNCPNVFQALDSRGRNF
ncbi:lactosylceramide 4-alpha-galactosyltransferase-like [Macrobrachium nipponense]|uniref:lactosylceramide 4-alpha-galactosyltransferase-like n=1 Tax=Macrobrachium nipponense TaxID=159736 RepID=UPI0030C89919